MTNKYIYLLTLLFFTSSKSLFAQVKFEKESRIKIKEVPSKALMFIDSLNFDTKIKWYKEEGEKSISIEAKFKFNKTKYSIEFDTLGNIEDIEIEMNWEDIESNTRYSICMQLKIDCSKFKIIKIQKQFIGSENELITLLKSGIHSKGIVKNFEIIVRCKQQKKSVLFEYLFDDKGKVKSISQIIFRSSSHLEY